jgi:adenylate kinase
VTSPALAGPAATSQDERRIIVMIGAPGAGKGTQARRLSERLELPHISSGELFRGAVREGTSLGEQVRAFVAKGALVPDELTVAMVQERLSRPDAAAGAILDGFPRTRAQAEALDRLLARAGSRVTAALYVEVAPSELVKRLSGRRVCSLEGQHLYHVDARPPLREGICDIDGAPLVLRKDDEPQTVRSRLDRQMPPMFEVVDHYADQGILSAVRGDKPADEVTEDLLRVVREAGRVA